MIQFLQSLLISLVGFNSTQGKHTEEGTKSKGEGQGQTYFQLLKM